MELDPGRERLRLTLAHRNSFWDPGAGYTVTPDNLQLTEAYNYTGGGTTSGFDGSTSAITGSGAIVDDKPTFISPGSTDTLVSAGYIDGTDAQWVMDAGVLHLTSGIKFRRRTDGLYDRFEDGRPRVAAKCVV
jgi:hypothetical protein